MFRTTLRRLYRLRRLFLLAVGFVAIALALNALRWGTHPGYSLSYAWAVVDRSAILLAIMLFMSLFYRALVCAVIPFGVATSVMTAIHFLPLSLVEKLQNSSGYALYFIIFFAAWFGLYGGYLDRVLPSYRAKISGNSNTPLAPEETWRGLYSLPDDQDQLYNADKITAFASIEGQPDNYMISERVWGAAVVNRRLSIRTYQPHQTITYRWEFSDDVYDSIGCHAEATVDFIATSSGGTKLTAMWHLDRCNIRAKFLYWIMDHVGAVMDDKLSALETKLR